jgi:thiol-disulfide isomerase/thioredoxin
MRHPWTGRVRVRAQALAALAALAALMFVPVAAGAQTASTPAPKPPAPFKAKKPTRLPAINDARLGDWLAAHQGQPVMLNFWASWCPPCREEMPALRALSAEGWPVLTIAVADQPQAAQKFLDRHAPALPLIDDADQTIARALKVSMLPTTLILDAQHRLRYSANEAIVSAPITARDLRVLADLMRSLAPPSP